MSVPSRDHGPILRFFCEEPGVYVPGEESYRAYITQTGIHLKAQLISV